MVCIYHFKSHVSENMNFIVRGKKLIMHNANFDSRIMDKFLPLTMSCYVTQLLHIV